MADTCPVCLDDIINEEIQLSCSHYIHIECSKGLGDTLCPICRCNVVWPNNIEELIIQNKIRYHKEKEFQELISRFNISSDLEFISLIHTVKEKYGDFAVMVLQYCLVVVTASIANYNSKPSVNAINKTTIQFLKHLILSCDETINKYTKIIEDFIAENFKDLSKDLSKDIFRIVIHPLLKRGTNIEINRDKITELLNKRNEIMESCSSSNLKILIRVNLDGSISYE